MDISIAALMIVVDARTRQYPILSGVSVISNITVCSQLLGTEALMDLGAIGAIYNME